LIPQTLIIASRALAKNKMRASLTILGVVIGIAAVTAMVSIGMSASQLVQSEFQNLGTNVIVVLPGNQQNRGAAQGKTPTLTADDVAAIAKECPGILAASPVVGATAQVVFGNTNVAPREMMGVGEDFLTVRNWQMRRGSYFSERDIANYSKVCVIGQTVAEKLFQTSNPIGSSVRINQIPFEVVGVLEEKGANIVGEDQDDVLLMPYTTVQKRIRRMNFNNVDVALASARDITVMQVAQREIESLMLDRHKIAVGQPPDFEVANTTEIAGVFGMITGTMTAMLSAIAGISLLVGGVGIMNIMLVSVTERTREIGIRMAVGATSFNILMQFLVESILLSVFGGLIGLGIGIGASVGLINFINSISSGRDWPVIVSIPAAVGAILFSAAVGVGFGYYPAWRASRLDPIDALRYE
jgi:putative ABC transport system permease protein